jgi:mannosyltransferase OCH1-like enzyme
MIPRLLSQTWKSPDLPPAAEAFRRGWRALNADLDYRFYDDAASREVVAEMFPGLLAAYDALPAPVMRADVFRYAVIYRDGGIYADIDMECLRPIGPLLSMGECLVSVEARLGRTRRRELGYAGDTQIANCIFAAAPGHPLFRRAVEQAFALFASAGPKAALSVEDLTGPRMLTRLLSAERFEGITILPQIALMAPLEYPNVWPLNRYMYARHRTFGTWKGANWPASLKRRIIERNRPPNPFPAGLGRRLSASARP